MIEKMIAFLVLAVAIFWVARWFYRAISGKGKTCVCGEDCPNSVSCSQQEVKGREK